MLNRDEYIAKMKLQLDELNLSMSKLEANAHEIKKDAQARYEVEMDRLRLQSQLAKVKFDELKVATENSWDELVAETEKVRDAFIHSFHYFKSQV
jgi:hypothetical protein